MRNLFVLVFIVFFFYSCKPSVIRQSFSGSDSLVIHFKNEKEGVVTKTVQTTDANALNRIIDFIDGKVVEDPQCGNDGKMFFYKNGLQVQEVDFNKNEQTCIYFSLLISGKIINTKMKSEAVDFFEALEKGLPFY